MSRLVQREGDEGASWWDKAVGNYKKQNDIKDDPNQSTWDKYEQWNNAATGRTQAHKAINDLEGAMDKGNAASKKAGDAWIDEHTDKDSWLRSLGHGVTTVNKGVGDFSSGLISGGLSAGYGMLDTVAHPLDAAVGAGKLVGGGLWGNLKQMGNLAGNLASTVAGDQTLEGTMKEYGKDEKDTLGGKLLSPFVSDIAGDPNKIDPATGKKDEGGHWAKAFGRLGGMIGVGALAGGAGELGAVEGAGSEAASLESGAVPKGAPTPAAPIPEVAPTPAAPVPEPVPAPAAIEPAPVSDPLPATQPSPAIPEGPATQPGGFPEGPATQPRPAVGDPIPEGPATQPRIEVPQGPASQPGAIPEGPATQPGPAQFEGFPDDALPKPEPAKALGPEAAPDTVPETPAGPKPARTPEPLEGPPEPAPDTTPGSKAPATFPDPPNDLPEFKREVGSPDPRAEPNWRPDAPTEVPEPASGPKTNPEQAPADPYSPEGDPATQRSPVFKASGEPPVPDSQLPTTKPGPAEFQGYPDDAIPSKVPSTQAPGTLESPNTLPGPEPGAPVSENAPRTLDPAEVSPNTQPRPGEETAPVTQRSPQSPPYTDPKIEVNFEGDPTPVQPQQPLPEPSMEPGPNSEPVKVEDPYAPTSATPGGPDTPVRNIEVPGGPAVPANDVIPESGVLGPQPPFEEQPVLAA